MIDNFGIDITSESVERNITRLTNQIWKLIPMKENNEDWEKQLNTVNLEIAGLGVIFTAKPQFLTLRAKLEGIKTQPNIEFELYRKTIFECLTLLTDVRKTLQ